MLPDHLWDFTQALVKKELDFSFWWSIADNVDCLLIQSELALCTGINTNIYPRDQCRNRRHRTYNYNEHGKAAKDGAGITTSWLAKDCKLT